jgi:hypothetical protein
MSKGGSASRATAPTLPSHDGHVRSIIGGIVSAVDELVLTAYRRSTASGPIAQFETIMK